MLAIYNTPQEDQDYLNNQLIQSELEDNMFNNASIYNQINSIQRKSSKNKKDLKFIIKQYKISREINPQEKKDFVRSVNDFLLFGKIKLKDDNFIFIINLGKKIVNKIEEFPKTAFSDIGKNNCWLIYIEKVLIMILEGIWNLSVDKENYEMHFAKVFL